MRLAFHAFTCTTSEDDSEPSGLHGGIEHLMVLYDICRRLSSIVPVAAPLQLLMYTVRFQGSKMLQHYARHQTP